MKWCGEVRGRRLACCRDRMCQPQERVVPTRKFVSVILLAAIAALGLKATLARAVPVTITFGTAPPEFLMAPVVESGFAYAAVSGSLHVSPNGRPGRDMEGDGSGCGGVLGLGSNVAGGTFPHRNQRGPTAITTTQQASTMT